MADVSLILPHNVNKVSWRRVCRLLDYPGGEGVARQRARRSVTASARTPSSTIGPRAERGLLHGRRRLRDRGRAERRSAPRSRPWSSSTSGIPDTEHSTGQEEVDMSDSAARERVMESIYVVLPEVLAADPAGRPELCRENAPDGGSRHDLGSHAGADAGAGRSPGHPDRRRGDSAGRHGLPRRAG